MLGRTVNLRNGDDLPVAVEVWLADAPEPITCGVLHLNSLHLPLRISIQLVWLREARHELLPSARYERVLPAERFEFLQFLLHQVPPL